ARNISGNIRVRSIQPGDPVAIRIADTVEITADPQPFPRRMPQHRIRQDLRAPLRRIERDESIFSRGFPIRGRPPQPPDQGRGPEGRIGPPYPSDAPQDRALFTQESGTKIKTAPAAGSHGEPPPGVQGRSRERHPGSGAPQTEAPAPGAEVLGEKHPALPL